MDSFDYLMSLGGMQPPRQTVNPSNRQTVKPSSRRGQAALEYVLVLASLLVVVAMVTHLIHAAKRASDRTVNLVGSDYP